MADQAQKNPYIVSGPVKQERLFIGQEPVFSWMEDNLNGATENQWLAILGLPRSGKSSVLWQVANGRLGDGVLPVRVDLSQLLLESPASFYRSLTETAVAALLQQDIQLTPPKPAHFVDRPRHAFAHKFLELLTPLLGEKKLLFAFDNVEALLVPIDEGLLPADTLHNLAFLLREFEHVFALFALAQLPEQALPAPLSFLREAEQQAVLLLTQQEAVTLIREPVMTSYTLVQEVARYIFTLTGGHPYALQLYGHALYERQAVYKLRQITVADVVAVHTGVQEMLKRDGWRGTAVESPLPAYELPGADMVHKASFVQVTRRRQFRKVWFFLVLLLILAVVIGIFVLNQ